MTPTVEKNDDGGNGDLQAALASILGVFVYADHYLDTDLTEPMQPPALFAPGSKENREKFQELVRALVGHLVEQISSLMQARVDSEVFRDAAAKEGQTPFEFLMEQIKRQSVDKEAETEDTVEDETDLSWMDEHPRFKKN
jgi:hypothetical protein